MGMKSKGEVDSYLESLSVGVNGLSESDLKKIRPAHVFTDDGWDPTPNQTGWSSTYYEIPEGAQELGDLIEHKKMNFNVGNIFKAAYRLGDKEGTSRLYDLNKIKWFVEREIAREENDNVDL